MAITSAVPNVPSLRGKVTLEEAVALFERTGHAAPKSTLEKWIKEAGVERVRHGRANYYSWSALLKIHAAKIRAR